MTNMPELFPHQDSHENLFENLQRSHHMRATEVPLRKLSLDAAPPLDGKGSSLPAVEVRDENKSMNNLD
jgi:hypothetical protein